MYPDHYAVPDGLDIRLIGTVRWKVSKSGHHVLTLWKDLHGNAYYCNDVWTPGAKPFWATARMSDLVECEPRDFSARTGEIYRQFESPDARASLACRFEELVYLWGVSDGTDAVRSAA